jgi:hypothetical protein
MHHPTNYTDRLYVKKQEGGTDMSQIDATCKAEIINIAEYLNTKYVKDKINHEVIKQIRIQQ